LTNIEDYRNEKLRTSLSSADLKRLEELNLSVDDYVSLKSSSKVSIELSKLKKIEDSEKKCLQDFIENYSKSEDSEILDMIEDAITYSGYPIAFNEYYKSKITSLVFKIRRLGNVIKFETPKKEDTQDKQVW
jgi:hypothetical protein